MEVDNIETSRKSRQSNVDESNDVENFQDDYIKTSRKSRQSNVDESNDMENFQDDISAFQISREDEIPENIAPIEDIQDETRTVGNSASNSPKESSSSHLRWLKCTNKDNYTWEELSKIEKHRRAVLLRGEYGVWESLLCFDGTVVTFLLHDSLTWITLLAYVLVRLQARFWVISDFAAGLGESNLTTIGGFITFFLTIYVNNSYARYFKQYNSCMSAKGRIFDVATLGKAYLSKTKAGRIVRYMNAANVAGYVGLSDHYNYNNFFLNLNEELGLLTSKELSRMNDMDIDKGSSCYRELLVWALREVKESHANGEIDDKLAFEFRDHILRFRAAFGSIFDDADLPIPFFFVHFICLLATLYLPLFAVVSAYKTGEGQNISFLADVVIGLVVVLQAVFVNGLRLLGQKMHDPFGDDITDLSVMFYITFTWTMSNRILESAAVDTSEEEEEMLKASRVSLGSAWEPKEQV
jgi:predicted membrane chloride channel (bestrophin family)